MGVPVLFVQPESEDKNTASANNRVQTVNSLSHTAERHSPDRGQSGTGTATNQTPAPRIVDIIEERLKVKQPK